MEASHSLGQQVRAKMLRRLKHLSNGQNEDQTFLKMLFREIDTDGSDVLSRHEFKTFCIELQINFSRRRWNQIFREIDKNGDNEITLDELIFFLYPESKELHEKEQRRIDALMVKMGDHVQSFLQRLSDTSLNIMDSIHRMSSRLKLGSKDKRVVNFMAKYASYIHGIRIPTI